MRRLLVLTLAVTVWAGQLATVPADATVPETNGRIAFARYDPTFDDTVTYTANPDGSHPEPLFTAYSSGTPHLSPDGTRVAVTSGLGVPCPPTCVGNTTLIIDPDTGGYRVLAPRGFPAVSTWCPIWSPDATAFACDGETDSDPSVNGVYTIRSSDGGGLTRITTATRGDDLPIDFSPDGRQIVFGHTGPFHTCDRTSALFVVNVDGTGLRRITPWGFCDDDGSWSPDGTKIAFATHNSVYIVHPDGTGLVRIPLATHSRSSAGDVSWSPDGAKIAFILSTQTGPRGFQEGIATADADGTHVLQVTVSPTFDNQAAWGSHAITR